mmetsp:Transcript_20548/g.41441  ORF Transcript_20548/g.41441 Transcript_20548/m.41441 type:complete len:281 (-) Transcript_20548:1276-2118(-)
MLVHAEDTNPMPPCMCKCRMCWPNGDHMTVHESEEPLHLQPHLSASFGTVLLLMSLFFLVLLLLLFLRLLDFGDLSSTLVPPPPSSDTLETASASASAAASSVNLAADSVVLASLSQLPAPPLVVMSSSTSDEDPFPSELQRDVLLSRGALLWLLWLLLIPSSNKRPNAFASSSRAPPSVSSAFRTIAFAVSVRPLLSGFFFFSEGAIGSRHLRAAMAFVMADVSFFFLSSPGRMNSRRISDILLTTRFLNASSASGLVMPLNRGSFLLMNNSRNCFLLS